MKETYFGNWTIESHLGSGSYGDVYKIKKEEFGVTYYSAMKIIRIPQDKNEKKRLYSSGMTSDSIDEYYSGFAQDFIKEIELMAKLQGNTNIVGYNDHIIEKNEDGIGYTIYIRMEYLTPLDSYLTKDDQPRFMTQQEVVKLGIDMCNALELCSKMHIIHRDIKPDNIFVSDNGDFKLGDFGIARKLEKTQSGLSRKGTINYMAPEVYNGDEYGESVDIYSLGVVLYRLLNFNRIPFLPPYPEQIRYTDSEAAFAKRINGEQIPYIYGVNDELNRIVIKACECNPAYRYSNASELKADLIYVSNYIEAGSYADNNTVGETQVLTNNYVNEYGEYDGTTVLYEENNAAEDIYSASGDTGQKKSKKGIILIIVAVIAVVLLLGIIFAIRASHKSGDNDNKETIKVQPTESVEEPAESVTESDSDTDSDAVEEPAEPVEEITPEPAAPVEVPEITPDPATSQPELAKVPSVVKLSLKKAKKKLKSAGLEYEVTEETYNNSISKGKVISQSIEKQTMVAAGTVIKLTVSKGKKPATPSPKPKTTISNKSSGSSQSSSSSNKKPAAKKKSTSKKKSSSDIDVISDDSDMIELF